MFLEAGVREALDEVREKGLKDEAEHVIVLRDGQRILMKDGDSQHVNLEDEYKLIQPGDVIVHNHPGWLNSLSNGDLMMARGARAKAIYAITDDGSIYKAHSFSKSQLAFLFLYDLERATFVTSAVAKVAQEIPEFTKRLNEAHWINKRLAKSGLMTYEFQLGEETDKLIGQFDKKIAEHGGNWLTDSLWQSKGE